MITLKGVSLAWRERARTAFTEVASSWRTSAAVRGEAGALLELKMIELHQQQALARVDADPGSIACHQHWAIVKALLKDTD